MARIVAGIAMTVVTLWAAPAAAATYQLTASPFTSLVPPSPNPFTTSMQVTGAFVTSAPVSANLTMQDISGLITSYSFSDGVHTFTQSNSAFNSPLNGGGFLVTTDAAGSITYVQFLVMSPAPPHTVGGKLNYLAVGDGVGAYDNLDCVVVQATVCSQVAFGATAARAFTAQYAVVTLVPAAPAMPVVAFIALAGIVTWLGTRHLTRHRPRTQHGAV